VTQFLELSPESKRVTPTLSFLKYFYQYEDSFCHNFETRTDKITLKIELMLYN